MASNEYRDLNPPLHQRRLPKILSLLIVTSRGLCTNCNDVIHYLFLGNYNSSKNLVLIYA